MISIDYVKQEDWKILLSNEKYLEQLRDINAFLTRAKQQGKIIFPAESLVFEALNQCPLQEVKVLILGQDPYHTPGLAHGLSFSVPRAVKIPPSLVNIYKEIKQDLGIDNKAHGNLSNWAKQGVLLLNAILTVNMNEAGSHQKSAWEAFTNELIKDLSRQGEHIVFMLWGKFAQEKAKYIDAEKHLILKSTHPSPLSAYRGFLGCQHFSKANAYLEAHGKEGIDWRIR